MNSPLSPKLMQSAMKREMERDLAFHDLPFMKEAREKSLQEWLAKPWWERVRIRSRVWVAEKRERLGEIIAGRRFD